MSANVLFSCGINVIKSQIHDEIHFQLHSLQIYYAQFLFTLFKSFEISQDEIINLFQFHLKNSLRIYFKSHVDLHQLIQFQVQLFRMILPHINQDEKIRLSRLIMATRVLLKLAPCLDNESTIISEIFSSLYYVDSQDVKNLSDLQEAVYKEPYICKEFLTQLKFDMSEIYKLYSVSCEKAIDNYLNNSNNFLKILLLMGHCSVLNEVDQDNIKKLLCISKTNKCLLKHITIEIGVNQNPEERYRLGHFIQRVITELIFQLSDIIIPDSLTVLEEKLCYHLILKNSFPLNKNQSTYDDLGWLILTTSVRGTINILYSLISNLISGNKVDELCLLLKSSCMLHFNHLLLVNLWHPDLANIATMQVLLDTCYPAKTPDSQVNYIEQLCLKIRTRWDTLKKFNHRLNGENGNQPAHSSDIIALTTMNNTSHLELVVGLSDPTGLSENIILELLNRTGQTFNDSLFDGQSVHLKSEFLEESCDKSIYFCAISIKKVWECLIMFSSLETRQMVLNFLYQNQELELIENTFYSRFCFALQKNDLKCAEEIYQEEILTRLEYIKNHIDLINPLSLRLELLENIYSLLFVTEYDLFYPFVSNLNQTGSKIIWDMPETVRLSDINFNFNDVSKENIPNLNKNAFICSFFLCKDLLIILEHHLSMMYSDKDIAYPKSLVLQDRDTETANYINYPRLTDIQIRMDNLSKSLNDLHWRIELLTTNKLNFSYESIGTINMPINVIFDSNSRQLSDVFRPRINKKTRAKLSVSKQHHIKNSTNHKLDNSDESPLSFNDKGKDYLNFSITKDVTSTSNEEYGESLSDIGSFNLTNTPKMNCQFLMESISWIIRPMECLAITALSCGFKQKASDIAKIYNSVICNNPILVELLTEIKYQEWFDKLVNRLCQITTPQITNKEIDLSEQNVKKEEKSFGHFDWKQLPVLTSKISSNKENDVIEIVNHLLMLNSEEKPFFKSSKNDETKMDLTNKNILSNKIKDFNSGLLFDLAINGCVTRWQLLQMLTQIQTHQALSDITLGETKNGSENGIYHNLPGLKPFVTQLLESVKFDGSQEDDNYTLMELKNAVESQYYTFIQKWLGRLHILIKIFQFNLDEESDFKGNNREIGSCWKYLNDLTEFLNNSLCSGSNVPYGYLNRNLPQYLKSLQSHLEVFVKFLNYHEQSFELSINNFSLNAQSSFPHEFSVLKRSPSDVIGELVFLKNINPSDNEICKISKDLGLNISEVILQNCLPVIRTAEDDIKSNLDSRSSIHHKTVHNQPEEYVDSKEYNLDPIVTVTNCLETVIKLIIRNHSESNLLDLDNLFVRTVVDQLDIKTRKILMKTRSMSSASLESTSNSSVVNQKEFQTQKSEETKSFKLIHCDWKNLLNFSGEEEWRKLLMFDIVELNKVNLDLLTNNSEKTAFFINLYNLMTVHLMALAVQDEESCFKYRSFKSKMLRDNFYYNIGQIGMLNISQISQYYLNIPDITFTDLYENHGDIVLPLSLELELRYRNNCPDLQNLVIFGMVDGTVSGPFLKIYYPESLTNELQSNISNIISYQSNIDCEKRQIYLPQIFKWFNKQINFNTKAKILHVKNVNSEIMLTEENLVERILSNCNDQISWKLSKQLHLDTDSISFNSKDLYYPKSVKIIWISRSETIGFTLIELIQDQSVNITRIGNFSEQQSSVVSTEQLLSSSNNIFTSKYHPTTAAVDHLRQTSPLLATIVYTIIGDDFMTNSNNLDMKSDTRRSWSVNMDEIYSYKFSRLQSHYAPIGNWLIRYWIPWYNNIKFPQTLPINFSLNSKALLAFCKDTVPIEIRWASFNNPQAKHLDEALIDYSMQFMNRNNKGYFLICAALRSLHSKTLNRSSGLMRLLDMLLVKSAHYCASCLTEKIKVSKHLPPDNNPVQDDETQYQENRLLDCIYSIKDIQIQLSESIRYFELLSIQNAVSLMEINSKLQGQKNDIITEKLKVLRIFKRIHDLVSICQKKEEIWFKAHLPTEFLCWQKLQSISINNPDQVFKFLIQQKQFDLCRKWCQIYMKEDGEEKIEAEFIVSLVNENNDKENIIQLTRHVANLYLTVGVEKFLRVLHLVIDHCETPLAIIVCCAFVIKEDLLSKFKGESPLSHCDILRVWVGASMLRSIPNGLIRDYYSHLVQHPDLILEQLIMNSQIDLFRKMLELCKEIRKAYLNSKKFQGGGNFLRNNSNEFIEELEPHNINTLLTKYTFKALELQAVRVEEDTTENSEILTLTKYSMNRNDISSDSLDTTVRRRPSFLENLLTNKTALENTIRNSANRTFFTGKWTEDKSAAVCMCCEKEAFSMFNRRHHCRHCGHVICGTCSTNRFLIQGVPVRICNDCHKTVQDDNKLETICTKQNLSYQDESPKSSMALINSDFADITGPVTSMDIGLGTMETSWKLITDLERNKAIRDQFYYADTPSITLAFSLTQFHSNSNECGNSLLDRVEYLSEFLKPMKNGLPNPEVDYILVIDIAKRIAYKAKEKFNCTNNDVDFARAEVYLSRLDLLGILVRSNYSHCLPSLSDGSKFREKIESLRDKLIREERLDLARIVSIKAGLSNDPVFVAMALHALEEGRYDEARKLFVSCTKFSRFTAVPITSLPYPLNEIMKILDRNCLPVNKMGEMLNAMKDNDDLVKSPELKYLKESGEMSQKQIEEAIYYFDIFDAPLHCLQFLCRQEIWSKAMDYAAKKNVSKEIFIDGLVAPAVTTGKFGSFKSEMLMREAGLNCWKNYYESICTYLDNKRCYEDLLELQELYRDHLRAAGTLVKYFFLRGAQSYQEFEKRINYLMKAQKHFEKLINQSEHHPGTETEKFKRNYLLIKEQVKGVEFLCNPITVNHHQAGYGYPNRSSQPPTLFGTPEVIADFCLTILFCRPNILDGLQMLSSLMPRCHIYPDKILPKAAIWLLNNPLAVIQSKSATYENHGVECVLELCNHIFNCYRLDSRMNDNIIISILSVIPVSMLQPQTVNKFIKLLYSEQIKIEAYIIAKDFKRAYVSAIKFKYIDDVKRILDLAKQLDDKSGVIDLCNQWLKVNKIEFDRQENIVNDVVNDRGFNNKNDPQHSQ